MNGEPIRVLTERGLEIFSEYLHTLGENPYARLPKIILRDLAVPVPNAPSVEPRVFHTKFEAADYLLEKVNQIYMPDKFHDPGLWAWFSAYYFDTVCPEEANGKRIVREHLRYIPEPKRTGDDRKKSRHLLAFPVRILDVHKNQPTILRLFLQRRVDIMGDFVEQLGSRQSLAMAPGILKAADLLYWDASRDTQKVGAATRGNDGDVRRFVDMLQQFEVTFDLYSLTGEQIVELLPAEFDQWKSA